MEKRTRFLVDKYMLKTAKKLRKVAKKLQTATFSMSDMRFYDALPAYEPNNKTKAIQSELGINPDWRDLGNNRRNSAVVNRGPIIIIAKRDHGNVDVELHELGHYFYFENMDQVAWRRVYNYIRKTAPKYHGQNDWRLIDGEPVFCGRGADGILEAFADLFKLFYQGKLSNTDGGFGHVMRLITESGGNISKVAGSLDFNSQIARKKLRSEIVRIIFYLWMGYGGPHPWGMLARPIYPEVSPLPIKDKNAGKETREAIEELMKKGYWDQFIRILLREVKTKLEKQNKGK